MAALDEVFTAPLIHEILIFMDVHEILRAATLTQIIYWFKSPHNDIESNLLWISAIKAGRCDFVAWLIKENIPDYSPEASLQAATQGKRMLALLHTKSNLCHPYCVVQAATTGDLAAVKYILKHFNKKAHPAADPADSANIRHATNLALKAAAAAGRLRVVKFLHSRIMINKTSACTNAMDEAAKKGHLPVVKFLISYGLKCLIAICNASEHGHLHIVKYLSKYTTESGDITSFYKAVEFNKLPIIAFYVQQQRWTKLYSDMLSTAVQSTPEALNELLKSPTITTAACDALLPVIYSLSTHTPNRLDCRNRMFETIKPHCTPKAISHWCGHTKHPGI